MIPAHLPRPRRSRPAALAGVLLAVLLALLATGTAHAQPAAPTSEPDAISRPETGDVVDARGGRGPGRVEIEGADTEAVLTLARGGRVVRSIYVRAHERAAVGGVPDGTYTTFVTTGADWDDAAQRFTRDASYELWPGDCAFVSREDAEGRSTSVWTFTLDAAPDGNIDPEPVAEDRYPR